VAIVIEAATEIGGIEIEVTVAMIAEDSVAGRRVVFPVVDFQVVGLQEAVSQAVAFPAVVDLPAAFPAGEAALTPAASSID
jgi:hypothetical protein